MRRHFDVVGETLHGDIRSLAELMAISNERVDRTIGEQDSRARGLEGGCWDSRRACRSWRTIGNPTGPAGAGSPAVPQSPGPLSSASRSR
jgi:hypothetical protein